MGIIATDDSGLPPTDTYYFKINGVEYDITTFEGTYTYEDVADLINTAISGAGFGAKIVDATGGEGGSDIRVYNDSVRGSGSECTLSNGTTGSDLFANLNFWPDGFRKPPVPALEPSSESFVIEREMSGGISLGGTAPADEVNYINDEAGGTMTLSGEAPVQYIEYEPTEGTAFFGDTYYQDEYYGDKG